MSAGFAAAAKRAGSAVADDAPEPDTPFYRGLKAILGRSGAYVPNSEVGHMTSCHEDNEDNS